MSGNILWGLALFTLSAASGFVAETAAGHQMEIADSGITGPAYSEIENDLKGLASTHVDSAALVVYGASVEGRNLRAMRISLPAGRLAQPVPPPNPPVPRPAVVISGSTHGNEYLNIEDRLPRWFLENQKTSPGLAKFLNAGGVIFVVPILNPDGYERRMRSNAHEVDLNRDFDLLPENERNFKEPESRAVAAWLDSEIRDQDLDLKVSVDYHCCADSLLFPWSYTEESLPQGILLAHEIIARAMQRLIDPAYTFGSTGQVLGYTPRGTSKDYYFARYNALSFTFEGQYGEENKKFAQHTQWWDYILASLVD
jgi:hypothetical protein